MITSARMKNINLAYRRYNIEDISFRSLGLFCGVTLHHIRTLEHNYRHAEHCKIVYIQMHTYYTNMHTQIQTHTHTRILTRTYTSVYTHILM